MTTTPTSSPAEPGDPIMLVLTGLLKLGPMKVSRILPNRKAVGFMIPVVAAGSAVVFALVGALIGWWVTNWFGGLDLVLATAALGGLTGYILVTARIEGRPIVGWLYLWAQSKMRGHVELNGKLMKLVTLPVKAAPPEDATIVAASQQTVVYAVPSRRYTGSEVYLGTAQLNEMFLGKAVIADSTVPEHRNAPSLA